MRKKPRLRSSSSAERHGFVATRSASAACGASDSTGSSTSTNQIGSGGPFHGLHMPGWRTAPKRKTSIRVGNAPFAPILLAKSVPRSRTAHVPCTGGAIRQMSQGLFQQHRSSTVTWRPRSVAIRTRPCQSSQCTCRGRCATPAHRYGPHAPRSPPTGPGTPHSVLPRSVGTYAPFGAPSTVMGEVFVAWAAT